MKYSPNGKWIQIGRYWYRRDGFRLPVIQGGGKANTIQNDRYAFGDDDNNEATHSLDAENTNRASQSGDVTFMLRIQVEETAGGTEAQGFALFSEKNGDGTGTFNEVTTGSTDGLQIANDTQSRADDENTTERLTGGSGTFTAGKYDDGQTQQGTTAVTLDTNYTDLEFAIRIDSGAAVDSDYWKFQVKFADGTDLDGYPVAGNLPQVTASLAAPQTVNLNTLQLLSNTNNINVQAGAATIPADTLLLQGTALLLNIVVPPINIPVNTLLLQSTVNDIIVSPGAASTLLDTLLLNATANNATVSPAAVSTALNTLLLQLVINDINVQAGAATLVLDTLLLNASANNITLSPAAVSILADTLLLQSTVNNLAVILGASTVSLNTLLLQSVVNNSAILAGAATTSLDTLLLQALAQASTVSPASVTTPLNTIKLTAERPYPNLADIDFETGDLSEFDSVNDPDSDLSVSQRASMFANYGMEARIDDQTGFSGSKDFSVSTLNDVWFRIQIDPNSLSMGTNEQFDFAVCQLTASPFNLFAVQLRENGSGYRFYFFTREDDATDHFGSSFYDITDGPHTVDVHVKRSSTDISSDGEFTIWIDDDLYENITNLDNYDALSILDSIDIGTFNLDVGTSGTFYLDKIIISSNPISNVPSITQIIPGPATINANTLSLDATANSIAISPGAVTTGLDTLLLQSAIQDITIAIGSSIIPLNSLLLQSSTPNITVTPQAVSIQLGSLELTASAINLDVVTTAELSVALNTLLAQASPQAITVSPSATSIALDTLLLEANANNIDILLGAVSIILDTLSLNADAISINLVPGAASQSLNTLLLNALVNDLEVVPGAVTTSLDTLLLESFANDTSISVSVPAILLDTLGLEAQAVSTAIAPAAVTLPLDTLLLDVNVLDIIVQIVLANIPGAVSISDITISDVSILDTDNG
jgi:hypothetical protein